MGDQDIGSPGRPVSSGLQVSGDPGIFVQQQDTLGELPTVFLLQNVLQLHQQRFVIFHVDSLALWRIISEEDAVLIPKILGENFYSGLLYSEFLRAGEPLCRHSIGCFFVSGSY